MAAKKKASGLSFNYEGAATETVTKNKATPQTKSWVQNLQKPTETGKALGAAAKSVGSAEIPIDVTVAAESLINTGNYENVKLCIAIRVPCPHDVVDQVFGLACAWVSDRMSTLEKHARGEIE